MNRYRVLIVDDEVDDTLLPAQRRLKATIPNLDVTIADSLSSARGLIRDEFFHAAFVDLRLQTDAIKVEEGAIFLHELRESRPSCRRFLFTQFISEERVEVFKMLDPRSQLVESVVDKANQDVTLVKIIRSFVDAWLGSYVDIVDPAELTDTLNERLLAGGRGGLDASQPSITVDEVDYVVSRLMGQGRLTAVRPEVAGVEDYGSVDDEIRSISLELLSKGRSRSIVAAGRPVSGSGREGVYCVVKVGLRREALEERNRYERYMRLAVGSDRRVEMLSSAMGDTIGSLCYAFAGRSPSDVVDLEFLLDEQSDRVRGVFERLFREPADWGGNEVYVGDRELGEFFSGAYHLQVLSVLRELEAFVVDGAEEWGGSFRDSSLVFSGDRLYLPRDTDFSHGVIRDGYTSSIVHGDLNAANVLVADDDRVMLIDFRHTTRGPRLIDYAALQASIRLSDAGKAASAQEVLRCHRLERRLTVEAWMKGIDVKRAASFPYWASVSYSLTALVRERYGEAALQEYLAVCLLYSLRVFRVTQLGTLARLRLAVWNSALVTAMR